MVGVTSDHQNALMQNMDLHCSECPLYFTMCNFWLPRTDCISTAVAETTVLKAGTQFKILI